jgi:hypothetical protein
VTKPSPSNLAASAKQRLLNRARSSNEDFNLLLTKYALERVLYRISKSAYRDLFILKGALLFDLWTDRANRATRYADFLSFGANSPQRYAGIFREICLLPVEEDGLRFDPETVDAVRIKENADYAGVRITFHGYMGSARLPVQIDIGFGDVVTPAPVETRFPTLLAGHAPVLRTYPRETVVAEKFEALVKLGLANTRMKDLCDLRTPSTLFPFESEKLSTAIRRTFERRGTPLPVNEPPVAFTPAFAEHREKNSQWNAWVEKNRLYVRPAGLPEVMSVLADFLMPLMATAGGSQIHASPWQPGGPWREAVQD